mmetsp:Transcript_19279/g.43704  ORF Transcript_19279/g.43704 Transcript_19279/m.43704 type:complete len:194 (-) Transcript_19279:193-774(-)
MPRRRVSQVGTNPSGNLLASAGRDGTVRFWDALSGLCVKTIGQDHRHANDAHPVGEATGLCLSRDGTKCLTTSRHGAVKLWDLRSAGKPLARYKGHQNSKGSFVRCGFGPREAVVVSGSDDGRIHLWETHTTKPVSTLPSSMSPIGGGGFTGGSSGGHASGACVYRALWCAKQSLLATCAEDGSVRTWGHLPG